MIKILPSYDLDKIKFATDGPTFQKAVGLYESGKVTEFEDTGFTFIATVLGTQPYKVFVSNKKYDVGGVDDSDGTVGGFIEKTVSVLQDYAQRDKKIINSFKKLVGIESCFGWEEPLVKYEKK